jgi:hypothetical protein
LPALIDRVAVAGDTVFAVGEKGSVLQADKMKLK